MSFLGTAAKTILVVLAVLSTVGNRRCAAQYLPNTSGTTRSPVDIPQTNLTPISPQAYGGFGTPNFPPSSSAFPPSSYGPPAFFGGSPPPPTFSGPPPSASLGTPLFDPYSTGANPGTFAPAIPGAAPMPSTQFPGWLSGGGSSAFGPGNPGFSNTPFGAPTPGFPSSIYPAGSPNTLFPGGLFNGGSFAGASGGAFAPTRLFQGPRLRYGWVADDRGTSDVDQQDIDASLVFAFPNFFYTGQPIYVVPSFGVHLLEGPDGSGGADLPPRVYDAFLDTGWQSDPTQLLGVDLSLRLGMFTDFDNADTSDAFRILGKALVTFRLTPYSTLKGGVVYLDRNDIGLLPAFGLLYQPTPLTRYDIYFPQPKLSQYFTTIGTQDVWGYIGGEIGGGSWAVRRDSGAKDSVDLNDYRVMLGAEWGRSELIRSGRHVGFVEVGYVWNRELIYKNDRGNNKDLDGTFMLRTGFGY